jgi:hypothetical protein
VNVSNDAWAGVDTQAKSAKSGMAIGLFVACANQEDGVHNPPPLVTEPDPTGTGGTGGGKEDPPTTPTDTDGISGSNASFASSVCETPVDMDLSAIDSNVIMTCGDNADLGQTQGASKLEIVNPGTGEIVPIQLPITHRNIPIRLTSAASGSGNILYVGFKAAGSESQFESDISRFNHSGIFVVNQETGMVIGDPITFAPIALPFPVEIANVAGVGSDPSGGEGGAGGTSGETQVPAINGFTPNSPILGQIGNELYAVCSNDTLNRPAALEGLTPIIDFAPVSAHAFIINADGSLSPKAGVSPQPISEEGNVSVLFGAFNPKAVADLGDGRIAILVQGVPGRGNSSTIQVLNTSNFESGLGETAFSSYIDLTDSGGLNFFANNSGNLAIIHLEVQGADGPEAVPHAIVGSADGSGRVALVNLAPDVPEETRTTFISVYKDAELADIAAIVADGDRAYVVSDTGKIRTLFLADSAEADGPKFGNVGPVHNLNTVPPGTRMEAALSGSSILVAQPGNYSQATTVQ